jgi:hypothetical protein
MRVCYYRFLRGWVADRYTGSQTTLLTMSISNGRSQFEVHTDGPAQVRSVRPYYGGHQSYSTHRGRCAATSVNIKPSHYTSDGVLETAVSARESLETGFSMPLSRLGLGTLMPRSRLGLETPSTRSREKVSAPSLPLHGFAVDLLAISWRLVADLPATHATICLQHVCGKSPVC